MERPLAKDAEANGYVTDPWTLPRAAEMIKLLIGVSYHTGHVWYILRDRLGLQLKKSRRQNDLIVFEDESGLSVLPSVRATWAPRGQTPVLRHRFGWKRLSLAAALVFEPDASDAHLVFQLGPGACNGETLIEFLGDLHQLEPVRWMVCCGMVCRPTAVGA